MIRFYLTHLSGGHEHSPLKGSCISRSQGKDISGNLKQYEAYGALFAFRDRPLTYYRINRLVVSNLQECHAYAVDKHKTKTSHSMYSLNFICRDL